MFAFRGILLAEEQRYNEAVQSYESAIHFRPRLAGEKIHAHYSSVLLLHVHVSVLPFHLHKGFDFFCIF